MSTRTTNAGPDEADRLRQRMVDDLAESGLPGGAPYPEQVLAAMRRVPRHVFVPDAALTAAYGVGDAVILGRDSDGLAVTSASAPSIVALHARPTPSARVREISDVVATEPGARNPKCRHVEHGFALVSPQPLASALWCSSPSGVSYVE